MTIEHSAIPNANLHEPKDVNSANGGEIYIADGAASGNWKKLPAASIDTTGATDGDVFYADGTGAGGWASAPGGTFGSVSIGENTVETVIGTIDTYVKVTAGLVGEGLSGVTFTTDHLTVLTAGTYKLDAAITLTGQVNDEFVIATSTDGTETGIIQSNRVHLSRITTGDTSSKYCIPLTYTHPFSANDDIYLIVKNVSAAANITLTDMSLSVILQKEA